MGDKTTREHYEQQPFIDHQWLFHHKGLRLDNVLRYFGRSKFYDPQCNNEELITQGKPDTVDNLMNFCGIQYVAEHVPVQPGEDPIFVVRKIHRTSPNDVQVLEVYYILHGMVYQAPTIMSVLNARVRRCAGMLTRALGSLTGAVNFDMGHPHMYRVKKNYQGATMEDSEARNNMQDVNKNPEHTATVGRVIQNLMQDHFQSNAPKPPGNQPVQFANA